MRNKDRVQIRRENSSTEYDSSAVAGDIGNDHGGAAARNSVSGSICAPHRPNKRRKKAMIVQNMAFLLPYAHDRRKACANCHIGSPLYLSVVVSLRCGARASACSLSCLINACCPFPSRFSHSSFVDGSRTLCSTATCSLRCVLSALQALASQQTASATHFFRCSCACSPATAVQLLTTAAWTLQVALKVPLLPLARELPQQLPRRRAAQSRCTSGASHYR